jgi:hypothetical protein
MAELAKSRFLSKYRLAGSLGAVLGLLASGLALAEEASDPIALELRKTFDSDGNAPETIDWEALNWDPWSVTSPAKQPTLKSLADPAPSMKWDGKLNPDGSRALTAKTQLPTSLDANVGVDLGMAPESPAFAQPRLLPGSPTPANTGSAWANVSVVPGASVDARLDPQQDQAKLGTTLKKSIPLNDTLSVGVENGYAVTDTYAAPAPTPAGPSALATPSRVYSTDGTARLSIEPTGTTFFTGTSLNSTDEKWRRRVGAEQKLFGGVNVSGSVKETDTGTLDKTFTAGFKTSW